VWFSGIYKNYLYNKVKTKFFIFLIFIISLTFLRNNESVFANQNDKPKSQVGIDEKLGQTISNDITLIDESGNSVKLKDIIDNSKPVILSLVYFRCPGICSPLLSGVAETIGKMDLVAGHDYKIVTVSFDPTENYVMAAEKKKNYFKIIRNKIIPSDAWIFYTADSANIARLTDAVGFRYIKQGEDFIHSGVLTMLSPNGKVVRYLYGTDFNPFDMKMAIIEASEGKVGSTIAKVMTLCFSYDPEGRKYALNITRIAGGGVILFILGFVIFLRVMKKKDLKNKNSDNIQNKEN
jgi:protein SCO1/2